MRIWRRSSNPLIRHLLELGLQPEQIARHLARTAGPPAAIALRPKPGSWKSWSARIEIAEAKRKAATRQERLHP
jgi:hypothetical protein